MSKTLALHVNTTLLSTFLFLYIQCQETSPMFAMKIKFTTVVVEIHVHVLYSKRHGCIENTSPSKF